MVHPLLTALKDDHAILSGLDEEFTCSESSIRIGIQG